MRIVVEICNGCISGVAAEEPCELLVIDRDQTAERLLPDGERGYVSVFDVVQDAGAVRHGYRFARVRRS